MNTEKGRGRHRLGGELGRESRPTRPVSEMTRTTRFGVRPKIAEKGVWDEGGHNGGDEEGTDRERISPEGHQIIQRRTAARSITHRNGTSRGEGASHQRLAAPPLGETSNRTNMEMGAEYGVVPGGSHGLQGGGACNYFFRTPHPIQCPPG